MENNKREHTAVMTGGLDKETKDAIFGMAMDSLTIAKRNARTAGYKKSGILDTEGMFNGHIVEIAVCHMIGVVQRYISYDLALNISSDLDMEGVDMELTAITPTGKFKKRVQLKHTYKPENRERESGAYLLTLHNSRGFEVIEGLFRYYHLPIVLKEHKSFSNLKIELDYIWLMYTESLSNYYSARY